MTPNVKKKEKKIGACFIRASLVCNAMCVPISAFTWLSPRASQSWDAVTCPSSLDQWEGRGEGTQSELLSSDCWCSLLSPPKWQELLGHLRTALQGVLLLLARRSCSLERWKRWLQNSLLVLLPPPQKKSSRELPNPFERGRSLLLSANIRDVTDALS